MLTTTQQKAIVAKHLLKREQQAKRIAYAKQQLKKNANR